MTDELDAPAGRDDQDLRALLAAVDPAASLPAADPAGVARLMEDAMSEHTEHTEHTEHSGTPETPESRTDHLHDRSRLTWIVGAAAAAVIVGGVGFAVLGGDDDPGPGAASGSPAVVSSDGPAPDPSEVPSVTDLTVSGSGSSAKCLTPEAAPQVVSSQTLVVDATVQSISGGVVTLEPTRFYAGEETDLVTVSEPSGDLQLLLSGVEFEEGGRYLVSATDGQVTLCGFSGPYSQRLADVYDGAFGG